MKIVWICGINPFHFKRELGLKRKKIVQHSAMTWIHTLINEIGKQEGIDLTVISSSYLVSKDYEFYHNNIKYYILRKNLPLFPFQKRFYSYIPFLLRLRYFYFRKKVHTIIEAVKPDLINCHGTENEYSLPIFDTQIPCIVEIQGYINDVIQHTSSIFFKQQLKYENKVFKRGNYFIIHTNYMDKYIVNQNPGANIFKCHYAVDQTAFELSEVEKDADISFAANLIRRKGIFDLIKACSLVKKTIPSLKVKIIGRSTNENFNEVVRMINQNNLGDNFIFLGYLTDHIDLLREVKKSKITVLPTYADTSPGTIGESMALGVPSIAYDVGGLSDMIENNISGILVKKGDIGELSDAIIYLLSNDLARKEMGIRAKIYAYENWSPLKVTAKMISIYNQVLCFSKI